MSLRLIEVRKESSAIGTKVRALAKELLVCESLSTFATNLNKYLTGIHTGNHTRAELQYCVKVVNEWTADEQVQIIHRRHLGDDVVVMTVNTIS
jgi:hypothetical protein